MPVTAGAFYPWINAGDGANNRKFDLAAATPDGTLNGDTRCDFSTGTAAAWILCKPLVNNNVKEAPAGGKDFGWNIPEADFDPDAGDLPAKRRIPAATWTWHFVLVPSAADATNNDNKVRVYVQARRTDGTFRQLFNADSGTGTLLAGDNNRNISTAQPEFVFENNETLHVEFWIQGHGLAVTGRVVTFRIGDPLVVAAIDMTISTGIRTRFARTTPAVMGGIASIKKKLRFAANYHRIAMRGIAIHTRKLSLHRTFSGRMAGIAVLTRRLTIRREIAAVMKGIASFIRRAQWKRTFDPVMKGIASVKKLKRFAANTHRAVMRGVATQDRRLSLHRTSAAVMRGVAIIAKKKKFAAANFGSVRMAGIASMKKLKRFVAANFGSAKMVGVASFKKLIRFGATSLPMARMRGVASMTRLFLAHRAMDATMRGVASLARVLRVRRTMVAVMKGRPLAFLKVLFTKLVEGGGGAIIVVVKKIVNIFDD